MRKLLYVLLIVLTVMFAYRYIFNDKDKTILQENSALIQEQIKNVSKLVVTEGHFSQVFTIKIQRQFLPIWSMLKRKHW